MATQDTGAQAEVRDPTLCENTDLIQAPLTCGQLRSKDVRELARSARWWGRQDPYELGVGPLPPVLTDTPWSG